jgi:hypothetical protein
MKIEIDWDVIKSEIAAGDYSTREELEKIRKKYNEINNKFLLDEQARKEALRVKELKALPRLTPVYYTGSDLRFLGKKGLKMHDKQAWIHVFVDNQEWRWPYKNTSATPMTPEDIACKKAIIKILS